MFFLLQAAFSLSAAYGQMQPSKTAKARFRVTRFAAFAPVCALFHFFGEFAKILACAKACSDPRYDFVGRPRGPFVMPSEPQDPRSVLVERFFQGTGNSYDYMVNAATLGIDRLWKQRIVQLVPPRSRRVADLACGTGISTLAVARHLPHCQVVGVELREEYLAIAREKVRRQGLANVEFVLSRAEDYRSQAPFDCISSSYLAKYADLPRLVGNARDMLEPGGLFLMHDFTYPPKPYLVFVWRLYFKALQQLGSPLFPAWREIFHGLPQLIERTRWLQELPDVLQEHGFVEIRRLDLTLYGSAIVMARRPT